LVFGFMGAEYCVQNSVCSFQQFSCKVFGKALIKAMKTLPI